MIRPVHIQLGLGNLICMFTPRFVGSVTFTWEYVAKAIAFDLLVFLLVGLVTGLLLRLKSRFELLTTSLTSVVLALGIGFFGFGISAWFVDWPTNLSNTEPDVNTGTGFVVFISFGVLFFALNGLALYLGSRKPTTLFAPDGKMDQ